MLYEETIPENIQEHISNLRAVVKQYLDSKGYHYQLDENDNFILEFNLECDLEACRTRVIVVKNGIYTAAFAPVKAKPEVFPLVREYLTRINYGMVDGHFKLDPSTGTIMYSNFLTCFSMTPPIEDVEMSIDCPSVAMQQYGNGLVKMLNGTGDPLHEMQLAE